MIIHLKNFTEDTLTDVVKIRRLSKKIHFQVQGMRMFIFINIFQEATLLKMACIKLKATQFNGVYCIAALYTVRREHCIESIWLAS